MAFDGPSAPSFSFSFDTQSTGKDRLMDSKGRPLVALVTAANTTEHAAPSVADGIPTPEGEKRMAKHYLTSILSSKIYAALPSPTAPAAPAPPASLPSSSAASSVAPRRPSGRTRTGPPSSTAWHDDDWFLASPELPAHALAAPPPPLDVAGRPAPSSCPASPPETETEAAPAPAPELRLDGKTYLEVWLALSDPPGGGGVPAADGRRSSVRL
ncbi:hypothetical protein JCM21900_004219 [Sporobolomyces salmonicolor]